jgi:hypothetical protein
LTVGPCRGTPDRNATAIGRTSLASSLLSRPARRAVFRDRELVAATSPEAGDDVGQQRHGRELPERKKSYAPQ